MKRDEALRNNLDFTGNRLYLGTNTLAYFMLAPNISLEERHNEGLGFYGRHQDQNHLGSSWKWGFSFTKVGVSLVWKARSTPLGSKNVK